MKRRTLLIAFLGPSLPAREAQALARRHRVQIVLLPPAAKGDVWRALRRKPRAIALIDGVFEARPSVWPREILAALEQGVAVFGGASMGALRAVELAQFGMVGVGRIYAWLRQGVLVDDGEVALLHGDATHGYVGFTEPLVNVRWIALEAVRRRVIRGTQATTLVAAAVGLFYQERRWPSLLEMLPRYGAGRWSPEDLSRFSSFVGTAPDLKALDARRCLTAAVRFARSSRVKSPLSLSPSPSALCRARF